VLLIEDDQDDAYLILHCLTSGGFEVRHQLVSTASGVRTALEAEKPDVILCDYRMPGFHGLHALEIAREMAPEVPLLIISGGIGEEHAVEAMRRGAHDYVMKDRIARLPSAVAAAIEKARLREENRRSAEEVLRLNAELRDKVEQLSRSNADLEQFA